MHVLEKAGSPESAIGALVYLMISQINWNSCRTLLRFAAMPALLSLAHARTMVCPRGASFWSYGGNGVGNLNRHVTIREALDPACAVAGVVMTGVYMPWVDALMLGTLRWSVAPLLLLGASWLPIGCLSLLWRRVIATLQK